MLSSVRQEQGLRRFKVSLFRNKYLLYEDDALQIGFKAEPIYERVDKFSSMVCFELYFGNKTDKVLNNFCLSFQGDKRKFILIKKAIFILNLNMYNSK